MKIKILEKTDEKIKFSLEGASPAFANSLRRIMLTEVPTMAIEKVEFIENSSALYDEIVAHRLGLIPLTFDPKMYTIPEECSCNGKGCAQCQCVLVLKKRGPCKIYSSDLKSTDEGVKPTSPDFLILELLENQEIDVEATARLGRGSKHSKHSAAIPGYKYYPSISVSAKCTSCKKCVEACPKKCLSIDDKYPKLKKPEDCILCLQCAEACADGYINIKGDPTHFIFTVETISSLSPENIILKAGEILQKKGEEFKKEIQGLKI